MRAVGALLLAGVIGGFSAAARAQCQPEWLHGFGEPGARWSFGITSGQLLTLMPYDSPHGPALLAGGSFENPGGYEAANLAYWTGDRWYPLATSMGGGQQFAIATVLFDDGTGEALYVGGRFEMIDGVAANNIARWDGVSWSPLGTGILGNQIAVRSLVPFDDGAGPVLVAIGTFTEAGGVSAVNVAGWDGQAWSTMGGGLPGAPVGTHAGIVFDDGNGPALYAGGSFQTAFGGIADMVAKWDGEAWSQVGCGMQGPNFGYVTEFAVHDDGSGPALYAAGYFDTAGCQPALNVARWDGTEWRPTGEGMQDLLVRALLSFDDGNGPALYAGTYASQPAPSHIMRLEGSNWVQIGEVSQASYTFTTVSALAAVDFGRGAKLCAAGTFDLADGMVANSLAQLDGDRWAPLGKGLGETVQTLAVADDGEGAALYAGGNLYARRLPQAPPEITGIVKMEAGRWSSVGEGITGESHVIATHDDGAGPVVAVGGQFSAAGGVPARNIALWDGQQWSALANGLQGGPVAALLSWTSGGQPALFAGGLFVRSGERDLEGLARWQDGEWTAVNGGVHRGTSTGWVYSLLAFDEQNGNGPGLYVGGSFDGAGQRSVVNVARWDETGWSALDRGLNGPVRALAIFDDGTGPALYGGGGFTRSGSRTVNRVAKWDGAEWQPVGTGTDGEVYNLRVHDDGRGPALYAAGFFQSAGGSPANHITRWDGEAWSALGGGLDDWFAEGGLVSFDDGSGPALWVGGRFESAGGVPSQSIAKWGCSNACDACDANCDGSVDAFDIEPFIEILLDPNATRCAPCAADVNGDGAVDAFDIEPFVACLAP